MVPVLTYGFAMLLHCASAGAGEEAHVEAVHEDALGVAIRLRLLQCRAPGDLGDGPLQEVFLTDSVCPPIAIC